MRRRMSSVNIESGTKWSIFAEDSKRIFSKDNPRIFISKSLKFVFMGPLDNMSTLFKGKSNF